MNPPPEELYLFGPLIREGRVAMQLAREEERRSTFGGRLQALKQEMPMMMIDRDQASACVKNYYLRRDADQIAALVATPKF